MNTPENSQSPISANITARDISGQVAIGSHNQMTQHTLPATPPTVTAAEREELRQLFEQLRRQVQVEAPTEKQHSALERVDELETAIADDKPDLTTIQYIRRWFMKNLPTVTGTITGIVVHPIVGKLVEAAGEMAADEFRSRVSND